MLSEEYERKNSNCSAISRISDSSCGDNELLSTCNKTVGVRQDRRKEECDRALLSKDNLKIMNNKITDASKSVVNIFTNAAVNMTTNGFKYGVGASIYPAVWITKSVNDELLIVKLPANVVAGVLGLGGAIGGGLVGGFLGGISSLVKSSSDAVSRKVEDLQGSLNCLNALENEQLDDNLINAVVEALKELPVKSKSSKELKKALSNAESKTSSGFNRTLFPPDTGDNRSKYEKLRDYMRDKKNFGKTTHERLVVVINKHLNQKATSCRIQIDPT